MHSLPQLDGRPYVTDGGLETTLVFDYGIDLPDFAAFPLLDSEPGRAALTGYHAPYFDIARDAGTGIVVDTATWRANLDWGARLAYDADDLAAANRRAVGFVRDLSRSWADVPAVFNGVIGPRGDGYVVGATMSSAEAAGYHALQAHAFADAGADMVTAVTMTYVDEAIGVVDACRAVGLPIVISFTVETDGRLPDGAELGAAIELVDDATEGEAVYFMVNCAHPTHFDHVLDGEWTARVRGIRANASAASHEELDAAEELDRGDADDLALRYVELQRHLPGLAVVGGCCGTDHEHVAAMARALLPVPGV